MFAFTVLTLGSLFATGVLGHGFIQSITIGDKTYDGWDPNTDPYASPKVSRIERKIPNDGPIVDINSPDLACNTGGNDPAGLVAKVAAGSQVTFKMDRWPDDHLGSVSHFMASCNGDCKNFKTSDAKWFKVDSSDYKDGVWATTKLIQDGLKDTTTIPANLKPGQYLLRHELIAFHDANQPQFYPGCIQLDVTGSGTEEPSSSSLVKIPGLYNDVKFPNIWADNFKSKGWTYPVTKAAFASSGSGSGDSGSSPAATEAPSSSAAPTKSPATSKAAPTSATKPSGSSSLVSPPAASATGKCRPRMVRRRAVAHDAVKRHAAGHAKRHHH